MKKFLFFIFLSTSVFSYSGSEDWGSENWGIGFGPSFSYEKTSKTKVIGLDLSYTGFKETMEFIKSPSLLTISLNPRILLNEEIDNNYGLDLQITWYLFINVGGGFGYSSKANNHFISHIFIGLPLGVINHPSKKSYYMEPYYRLNYINGEVFNEFGIMFKINTLDIYFH